MKAVFAPRPAMRLRSIRSAAALYPVGLSLLIRHAPRAVTCRDHPSGHYIPHMQRSSSGSFPDTAEERDDYLSRLGERVREERARRGMTRRILARDSGLSERYLAQLESGKGNLSIKLLRRVGDALNLPLPRLLGGEPAEPAELGWIVELLRRLPPDRLGEARAVLDSHFAAPDGQARQRRIALIGLRGAGKSTLGRRRARHRDGQCSGSNAHIGRGLGLSP